MTKKELKEAIAATITENGQKGITGQALANLLNEIVDAAGDALGGYTVFVCQMLHRQIFAPESSKENLQNTALSGVFHDGTSCSAYQYSIFSGQMVVSLKIL